LDSASVNLTPGSSHPSPSPALEQAHDVAPGARIQRFIATNRIPTPFVVVDLDIVRENHQALAALFPRATIFYAVKANPSAPVIAALAALGAKFDLASEGEIARCRDAGVSAARLSFGNTVKREAEIARAGQSGIDLFAFDSIAELEKIARAAPGARVFCRMLVENKGADWPLTRKFGCTASMVVDLLRHAPRLGLRPVGVSFHVGSQQTDPQQWRLAIAAAAGIFHSCARAGLDLELLNVGGGFPAHYRTPVPPLAAYAEAIYGGLAGSFGATTPQLVLEPGRYLVGDAGILRTEVLLVAQKSRRPAERWVYLDAGRYNGLPETQSERIQYRFRTPHDGKPTGPVILAGPTCDSTDILYQRTRYDLPLALSVGDPVDVLSAGAYTASYASVEFNGFTPVRTYCI
jgi:ornithine decarboxylase